MRTNFQGAGRDDNQFERAIYASQSVVDTYLVREVEAIYAAGQCGDVFATFYEFLDKRPTNSTGCSNH